tara:strand:+ start:175 stop:474 length:300 start_codon:yes stop_codon:yes gene_type:complete
LLPDSFSSNEFGSEPECRFDTSNRYQLDEVEKQEISFSTGAFSKKRFSQQCDENHPFELKTPPDDTTTEVSIPHQIFEKPSARSENEDGNVSEQMRLAP